jgi:uncharacterized membrane protein YbhN (UPF0104 family)
MNKNDVAPASRPREIIRLVQRRTWGRWLIGSFMLAGLVAWVHWSVGWGPLLAPWLSFPPERLLFLFLMTSLSYLLRAVRIYDYSRHLLHGLFPATLRLSLIHNTLNNFLPMRLGELAYPVLMRRYFGQGLTASGVTLLWIRALDLHLLGLLALLFLAQAHPDPLWAPLIVAWIALVPAAYWGHARLQGWSEDRTGRLHGLLRRLLGHVPASGWGFFRVWVWTALSWGCKFIAYTAVVLHFVNIETWRAVLGTIGAELSSVLPVHGIAGSGSYEIAMAAVLVPLGLDMATVLKAAVNLHLYLLGASLLLGLGALLLPRPAPSDSLPR